MAFNPEQKKWAFIILFVAILSLAVFMLWEMFSPIFMGGLLAYFLYPIYKKLKEKFKSQLAAQLIVTFGSLLVVLILVFSIFIPLVQQTKTLYAKSGNYVDEFLKTVNQCSADSGSWECKIVLEAKELVKTESFKEKSQEVVQKISVFLFDRITGIVSSLVSFVLSLIIAVFALFYFLSKGEAIKKNFLELLPLDSNYKHKISHSLEETVKAVVGGNISTALLQGVAGSIIFFILGIPAPLFWGLVMAILAFIPLVGPGLIWIPAALILLAKGNFAQGIILIVYCLLVLGYIDNFLKPKFIGDKIKLSSFAIFLGVIGGLKAFGIMGLFFGPLIISLLVTGAQIYREMQV